MADFRNINFCLLIFIKRYHNNGYIGTSIVKKEILKNKKNLVILLVILVALPLTILLIRKVQDLRSRAAGQNASLTIPTAQTVAVNSTVNVPITLNTDSAD